MFYSLILNAALISLLLVTLLIIEGPCAVGSQVRA